MLNSFLTVIAVFLLASCASPVAPVSDLKGELEAMYDSDQTHRLKLQELSQKHGPNSPEFPELWKEQQAIDEANIKRLDEIIEQQGWPKRSVVGDKAAAAAFLIVQHADLPTQKRYFPLLQAAVAENEARTQDLALLEDRILMREGKKQRYGSQLRDNGEGRWEFYPIEDEANVEARRKAVGLPPLAEYAKHFGIDYQPVGAQPAVPVDSRPPRP